MSKIILYGLMILFFITGCAATPIISFTDESTNAHFVRMKDNGLAGGIGLIQLNAQRFEKKGEISFSLFVVYTGPNFIYIGSGKSLMLIIDGQRNELAGMGSEKHRNIIFLGVVEETASYHDIDPDLIRRLANAKQVEVYVKGSTDVLERHFKKINFNNFKNFYSYISEIEIVTH